MKFGIELLPNSPHYELEYYAKLAEDSGFGYVWITDHYNNRNAFVILTAIAKATNSVKLGTGVTNPFHVNPAVITSAIATINEISGGRAILGLGAGDKFTLRQIGIEQKRPLRRVREAVEVIRKLSAGEVVNYEGEEFRFEGARMNFRTSSFPIYVGAQGPKMLRLASEIGDGVIINASHPKDVEFAIKNMNLRDGFDIAVCSAFSVDKNRENAVKAVKPVVAFIVSGCPKEVLERHGIDEEVVKSVKKALNEAFTKGNWKAVAEAVTEDMIEAFSITGTPDEVVRRIEELERLGVTQFVVGSPIGADKGKAIKTIGKKIIPRFK